jgi:hypothetical protein
MNATTIVAIGTAAMQGVAAAVRAWPTVQAIVTEGRDPTPSEQATLDAAADAAHAALQNATHA